ncbi:AMP-dependent synthetase/ligase [Penicillium bovifimosum]|uniref:AMP-dependent synthetase/ligase n=1 Tax=Penicillium bovifimosum TaxID=126998 RepID=A0A9W9HDS1_9EURO|nr:AMP-dependent synthetase/ligase [Penicillium bovifimosum]KAJ5143841.1 AMP-dependent synthetase/ligase [Penicillium bovifimosum]
MGFIPLEDVDYQNAPTIGIKTVPAETNGDNLRAFPITQLASELNIRTGMKEEIVLLSWLMVLLRSREDSQVSFDWFYSGASAEPESVNKISMNEVMNGLQSNVAEVATAISRNITAGTSSTPASLILSTSSLLRTSEEAKDEGVLHLEVRFQNANLEIRPVWHTENILPYTVNHHVEALADTVRVCLTNPDATIERCLRPTESDLNDIWGWNHELPPTYSFCMQDMVAERAREYPDKVAIDSWDGSLTYGQIDQWSTSVASSLRDMGVELHDVLPVCFEKSRWTIIAVLGVMKAGATLALMDPTLPLARLQNMAVQVGAKGMVSSRKQYDLSMKIMPEGKHFVVEEDAFTNLSHFSSPPDLPAVPPSALMYIIFTSGSTGTPKGVKISHETYTSSAIPRAKAVGYTPESRVLDFASYAFDVSIDSMLLTLGNGGCLCIPSDEDRLNDINEVIRRMRINYAGLTPSVGRILDADVIASLSGLGLGGEAVSARDANNWGRETRIIIGYGPCECTIGCTVNSSAATGRDYLSIGPGNGAAIWIADPNDHNELVPVGAVGELLVEGPIVGQGYLNDPDKTAASFINDPTWLVAGHKQYAGRRGRLYKTGDLGRYDPDGLGGIVFVGRKDTQVKLRGQRVELGEIESQLKAVLPSEANVIAEVINPKDYGGQPMLVAFVAFQPKAHGQAELALEELSSELNDTLTKANAEVSKTLPRYMVPTTYIPINVVPVLISGKTDRKQLRAFGATVDLRQLDQGAASTASRELTEIERRLRQAWAETLKLEAGAIRPDDNFFALGGDSLAAMRLVSVCRAQGLDLSVISTFGNPTLSAMATVLKPCSSEAQEEIPAFSLISQSVESARLEAAQACGVDEADVEDIYLCTPTQESLFTFSLKSTKAYIAQRVACIPSHIELDAWKKAWEDVVAASPILRSRLAPLQDPGLQQIVLKEGITWRYATDLEQYLENDRSERMNLGQSLARYGIVTNANDDKRYMIWTVHHVLYDGWSEPIVLKQVSDALQNQCVEIQTQMRNFVKYVRDTDETAMHEFWRRELKGAVGPQFPRLPSRDFLPTPNGLIEHQISLETGAGSPFTMATLVRGAWALVASQYTGSDDVVFGETLTGRDIPLPGVESIVGPLIATIPIRIQVRRSGSVESYLQTVQQAVLARTPYQHMGMQNIRKVSQDAQYACESGTGLVIQPDPEYVGSELGFELGDVVREALHFNPYPLMVAFGIRKGGLRVCASFDSSLIEGSQMQRILAQLETACLQLSTGLDKRIDEISCLPAEEVDQIWQWNRAPPLSVEPSSGNIRAHASTKQGSVYPRAVVPWVCDARNPSLLSPIGSVAGSSACAGRSGKVQPTGDMVQLQDDGSLVFVGRKENVVPLQGHAVDIADLESHFAKHLPPNTRAAASVFQPLREGAQKMTEQELAIFIENQSSEEDSIRIMPGKYEMSVDHATICDTIPVSLAVSLKKLDKFIRDSLPSYMAPSGYVVVDKLPTGLDQLDRTLLNQLASKIPHSVLNNLRSGFKEAWTKGLAHTNLSPSEKILQTAWAKILRLSPEQIDVDDNFFRLGGDSVLAMKLVSSLRTQGHSLSVADIFQHMRLGDAAKVLKVDQAKETSQPYKTFSALSNLDVKMFLASTVRPKLANPGWPIQDVSPATDSQALDIRGTIGAPRTSVQYTMMYFDQNVDRERLVRACTVLVKTHDILRTVFIENESSFLQVVLEDAKIPVAMHQDVKEIEQYVTALCTADIESSFELGSPFLKIFHIQADSGKHCLVIRLSHAQYDGVSLPRLLQDLETLYAGGKVVDFEPFATYMARVSDGRLQTQAIHYWNDLLKDSTLSVLNGPTVQPTDKAIFHSKAVESFQPVQEITTANVLTAAWALVLARRLRTPDVTFGSVTSGRSIDLANVENVMGPCYQLTPVRVKFQSQWTAMDLLRFVQKQSAESAAHDFLGFEKISKECTPWSSDARSFDSIVHHQDWDEFDDMPFAGSSCKVDILNPHGDAAYPLKAVSFVRGGKMHVGFVGSETDATFVDNILDELAAAVQELSDSRSESLVLV